MRIGIDARMYSPYFTGIGRYTHELIRRIPLLDPQHQYYIFLPPSHFEEFVCPNQSVYKVLARAPYYSFEEQTTLNDLLLRHNLDLMHFTHFNAPYLYNRPFIVTIHDLTLSFFKGKKRTSFIERVAYNLIIKKVITKSRHIIAVSENTKNDIRRLFFTPKEKISVIYEGVGEEFTKIADEQRLQKTKEKYNLTSPFILYTGVWRDHKNITGLIQAFHTLMTRDKRNLLLIITGREDPYYPEVKTLPRSLGIEQAVRLTGFVTEQELVDLYNMASCFVLPSFYEGFGLPILESMSCGTPVACSNVSSFPEIGKDACLYFDPHDTKDIADKIRTILDDKPIRDALITAGYKRIRDFSWDTMARQTHTIYQRVLGQ